MTNTSFVGNFAGSADAVSPLGGGVYQAAGNLSMTDCTFGGNGAGHGGGLYQAGGALTLTSCTFANDFAASALAEGGALYVGGTATIQSCAFEYDQALGNVGGQGFGGAV